MREFIAQLTERLSETFDPGRAGEAAAELIASAFVGLVVMVSYYFAWRILDLAARPALKRMRADATSAAFVSTVLKYTVLVLGLVHALNSAGVNTAGILASLGVVGLTIGFAARDALSNIVSGILIFWDRPFVIGDLVDIAGSHGRVDRITLRSTRVVTADGRMLAVPNTEVINTTVASYTNFRHLRLDVSVTIGVRESIPRVRELLLGIVAGDSRFMEEPKPRVVVKSLGDYNLELELHVWLDDERRHLAGRFELRERIFEVLTEAGVDMPYETFKIEPIEVKTA